MRIENADQFMTAFSVSRETAGRLETYAGLIATWQKAVNLVAPRTLTEVWHRHFADSAQLAALLPERPHALVDIGAGGGFPGLVLAVMLADCGRLSLSAGEGVQITLIESDQRKAAFLREAARQLSLPVNILSTRIENPATQSKLGYVDVVTARAVAPLDKLLALALPVLAQGGITIFPKGREALMEVAAARAAFEFEARLVPSRTEADARIVVVSRLEAIREG